MRKKLIEVALPLEAINIASAREKSIRHGHPSTLHLWWARRPLAAARAVIFAQMVDDPSSHPDIFRTEKAQDKERQRLFRIIEDLVKWESTSNEEVLDRARSEIWQSWKSACADYADHPRAKELFNRHHLPAFHDPFAGGGALPLEAQRLGLESYASDLNPVAVLINKAMIEIPPKFAGQAPINTASRSKRDLIAREWRGAHGLAEDVRFYGKWIRNQAEKRIGHLYPNAEVSAETAKERPDLKLCVGKKLNVIAWIWARTVRSPNPAFAHVEVPLTSTFMLSDKPGHEAYVQTLIEGDQYRFTVRAGKPKDLAAATRGTKSGGSHSSFVCLMSETPIPFSYLRAEAKAGHFGTRLMAVVAEGESGRIFLSPTPEMESIAVKVEPQWKPEVEICHWPGRTNVVEYGLTEFGDLFTGRQLVALTTFSDLISEARQKVLSDALDASMPNNDQGLDSGGIGAKAYAEAVGMYLAFGVDYAANYWSVIATPAAGFIRGTFSRQAIPMTWDFVEAPPFGTTSGNWLSGIEWISKALEQFPLKGSGDARQADAATQIISLDKVISTDPPYYDNIGYADLSDYFYVWMRRSQKAVFPDLFGTVAVPKAEELVATPYRHGGKDNAEKFFLNGMTQAIQLLAKEGHPAFPVTIYYAFKQAESDGAEGTASTGWETFLDAIIRAGFALSGTWPMRTERGSRSIGIGSNALASSIILVCRPREANAPTVSRREFLSALKGELPLAVKNLQLGNIAPVDLAQAVIGPGMAVYTRFAKVLEADGKPLTVHDALTLINQTLDESLAQQEGEFDANTRWAVAWFEQSGFETGEYGVAEMLSKAKNTSVTGMVEAKILSSKGGKVQLLKPAELRANWDPGSDTRLTAWEVVHQLVRALEVGGESSAADLVAQLGIKAEAARELAYRLYTICERKKRAPEALSYNALVQSWPEIMRLAQTAGKPQESQTQMFGQE